MTDLLEWLFFRVRVMYLSDLREPHYWPCIVFYLNRLEAERFSLKEWEEAVSYIFTTGYLVKYRDIAEAKEDCMERLERYRQEEARQKNAGKEFCGWSIWGDEERK